MSSESILTRLQPGVATDWETPSVLQSFLKRSARQQWGIFLGLLLVLLIAAETAFTWYVFRDGLIESAERSRDLARTAAGKLEVILTDHREILEKAAQMPSVKASARYGSQVPCDPFFQTLNEFRAGQFESLNLNAVDGRLICEPRPMTEERTLVTRSHPWFEAGLQAEGFAIGHVFMGWPTMRWRLPLTHPVRDDSGATIGLLVMALDLQTLSQRIFTEKERVPGFRGGIADGTNRFLAHTDPELIGETTNTAGQRIESIGDEMYRVFGSDGIWRLVGGAPIRATPWRVFIGVPEELALADARRSAMIAAGVGVLVFGLFAAGVFFFGRINVARDDSRRQQVDELTELQGFFWANIPEGAAFFDSQGVILEANDQLARMLGRPRSSLLGHKLNEYAADSHGEPVRREALHVNGRDHWTTVFLHPDGSTIDIETKIESFSVGDRKLFIGVFRDFTELKRVEADRRKSEELLEQTGRVAGVGGWELDLATMRPRWTSQTRRLHEVPDDYEPTLEEAIAFFPEDARKTITHLVKTAISDGAPYDVELPFVTAKGRSLWVRAQCQPIVERGKVVRLIGSFQDVTARRLAERQLEEERARAEIASKAKSAFIAIMSHELRTPLTGILGTADLLQTYSLTPQQRHLVDRLSQSGRVLLDLINDVLDFSKIESSNLTIERVPFVPRETFESVRELLEPLARRKGLGLSFTIAEDLWGLVQGDQKRLRQVLMNLVGNAVKFTEQGSITVEASYDAGPSDTECILRVKVVDTGVGIAATDLPNLFKPYVQGDQRVVSRAGGTGLGLAISKLLVEAMGGTISVSSTPGKGSTFSFTIVLTKTQDQSPVPGPVAQRELPPSRRKLHILVAEDNETSRYLIAQMLQRRGHHVIAVENGAEAVASAQATAFDIVLMDMQMPVMNGMDAVRAIRQFPGDSARLPIIALTADLIDENRSKFIEAGVDVIVGKPIDWKTLESEIEHLICERTSARPAGDAYTQSAGDRPRDDAANSAALLDRESLRELTTFLGPEKLGSLLASFRENVKKYHANLHVLAQDGDLQQAKREAHALKGLSIQFGAVQLSRLADDVENRSNSIDDVRAILPLLDQTLDRTLQELDDCKI